MWVSAGGGAVLSDAWRANLYPFAFFHTMQAGTKGLTEVVALSSALVYCSV